MDARELEALSMLSRGFADLRDANPELAYNVILDILSGINEYAHLFLPHLPNPNLLSLSNNAVRQHVTTSRGLFPHKRITRKSEMTSRGLVVVEQEEEISGLPASSSPSPTPSSGPGKTEDSIPARKSPIAELLYMRWLEGLKIKWPSIL